LHASKQKVLFKFQSISVFRNPQSISVRLLSIMSKASRHNKVQKYESALNPVNKTDPRAVCKHCVHLNKSLPLESELPTNHWLRDNRDPGKRFICPVILQTRCEWCHKKGHDAFWCAEKPRCSRFNTFSSNPEPLLCRDIWYRGTTGFDAETARMKPAQKVSAATSNAFACLEVDSGSDREDTKKKRKLSKTKSSVQESASTSKQAQPQDPVKSTYASYAKQAMSYEPPRAKNRSHSPSPEEVAAFRANPPRLVRGSWADAVDDDSV